ncbi:MAG: amidohydrolase family protein [Gemmatimonadetes bacterium]|nr:amidohydrolase family protein [Gemmatimonadota bacterium]
MSRAPAAKLGLRDRGQLAVGMVADIVLFQPDQVGDTATFEQPHQYPAGIPHVVVGGVVTLRDGEQTGARAGRAVRGTG